METENKRAVTLAHVLAAHRQSHAEVTELKNRVEEIVTAGGEPNVINAIKNGADALPVTDKAVDIGPIINSAINSKLASTYKAGGSVAFAALPTPDEAHLGFVYNVTSKFTTTADFVEGAGGKHPAGTNVAIVAVTDGETTSYKYDVLAGFVDLSGLQPKEEGKGLSEENFTAAHKAKLDSIEFATDEEVAAGLAEIYNPTESGGNDAPSEATE